MAFSRSFLNNSLAVLFFSQLVGFYDSVGMDTSSLSAAIEGQTPLHIVTLTRTVCDTNGSVLSEIYPPISAAEAATMFSIVNCFLGNNINFAEYIQKAHEFDIKQFTEIESEIQKQNHEDNVRKILLEQLEEAKIENQQLKKAIIEAIIHNESVNLKVHAKIDSHEEAFELKGNIPPFRVNQISTGKIKKSDFVSCVINDGRGIPQWLSDCPDTKQLKGEISCYVFNQQITSKQKDKISQVIASYKTIDEELKGRYFRTNPFLFGYLGIPHVGKVEYFLELFDAAQKAISAPLSGLSVFAANELFFGKDFILPNCYPSLLPQFSLQTLTCINFLLEENKIMPGVRLFDEKLDQSGVESNVKWPQAVGSKYFRNVSFYKVGSKPVQEYSKSSYFRECDSALENGYTYLFGQRLDFIPKDNSNEPIPTQSCDDFTKLISTQICFDLQTKRRANQTDYIPIHIFQSNTHDLSEVLAIESHSFNPSQADIPGKPKLIIHADPKNQELFVKHEEKRFDYIENSENESFKLCASSSKTHYTTMPPQESFTFSINKGGHVDSYTITHWVLKQKQ